MGKTAVSVKNLLSTLLWVWFVFIIAGHAEANVSAVTHRGRAFFRALRDTSQLHESPQHRSKSDGNVEGNAPSTLLGEAMHDWGLLLMTKYAELFPELKKLTEVPEMEEHFKKFEEGTPSPDDLMEMFQAAAKYANTEEFGKAAQEIIGNRESVKKIKTYLNWKLNNDATFKKDFYGLLTNLSDRNSSADEGISTSLDKVWNAVMADYVADPAGNPGGGQ